VLGAQVSMRLLGTQGAVSLRLYSQAVTVPVSFTPGQGSRAARKQLSAAYKRVSGRPVKAGGKGEYIARNVGWLYRRKLKAPPDSVSALARNYHETSCGKGRFR